MDRRFGRLVAALLFALLVIPAAGARAEGLTVTRATLANGLEVVVVRNPLAPVVTTVMNYRAGSNEERIDGQAHALEHMMFRGSASVSADQLMDTIDVTGGDFDADTQNAITQYYFTVPSEYLDIALRLERSRATGLSLTQSDWNQERGAITQEVTQDNSSASYRLFQKMLARIVGGTPYAKNTLGSIESFAHHVNAPQLQQFYREWYHPNNAVYVIVGDVDGPATIAKVKALFGDIPAAKLPSRPAVSLQRLRAATYRDTSDQPYTEVLIGYRMPGYASKEYAAAQILSDVLNSQRGNLFELAASGKAYGTEFALEQFRDVSVGIAVAAVPITTKPEQAGAWIRGVIDGYRKTGVPADLVEAAKRREVADLEAKGNSIEGLAFQWSDAVAVEHLTNPSDELAAISQVTVADVNRVLRTSLDSDLAVTAYAVPKNSGATGSGGALAKENVAVPPSKHSALPDFAQHVLEHLSVPQQTLAPSDVTLANGIRIIVQPEPVTHYVEVSGLIRNNTQVQEPAGKDGVADITSQLLPYGTTTYGRVAFQAQLDDIAANVRAGTDLGAGVPSRDFDRAIALLADEELHPAFDPKAFAIVKAQSVQGAQDEANSPEHLAAIAEANALYPPGDPQRRFESPQTVQSITLDDVKAWYGSAYRPDMTTFVVVGDVTPAQVTAAFEKYFGGWSATGAKPNVFPPPVPPNAPADVVVPANGRVQSSVVLVQTTGVHRVDPDWADLAVANAALTGGFYSSLLYHDLREIHGYAYSISSQLNAGRVRSTFLLQYGCDPKNIAPAQQQIQQILREMQAHGIEADRLLRSKAMLIGQIPIQQASYNGLAGLLLDYAYRELPLDQNLIDARNELDVTSDAIRAATTKWIRPDGFVRVVTGPGPQ